VSYTETGATPSQGLDASTMESFANAGVSRPRYDSNQLLTLPAPLALNRPVTTGGSSSTSFARSSEDVYSDNTSSSHQRLVSTPAPHTIEQPVDDHYGASVSTQPRRPSPGNRGAVRQGTSPTPFPRESTNPFRTSNEYDPSPSPYGGQRRVRGISLSDNGPVPGPDGVRRISRPSSSRRTSQPPSQNRYSRTTSVYGNLPAGAAPPNPNGASNGKPGER
jgi:chitin synthase